MWVSFGERGEQGRRKGGNIKGNYSKEEEEEVGGKEQKANFSLTAGPWGSSSSQRTAAQKKRAIRRKDWQIKYIRGSGRSSFAFRECCLCRQRSQEANLCLFSLSSTSLAAKAAAAVAWICIWRFSTPCQRRQQQQPLTRRFNK